MMEQNCMEQNAAKQPEKSVQNPYVPYAEAPEEKHKRAVFFRQMALPTAIYALVYTVLLYDNFCSITMPLFVVATGLYCFYCMEQMQMERKAGSMFYMGMMLLLGISSFLTGNHTIIAFNTIGILLLLICMLLHNFYDDSKWGFGKYFGAIFTAIFGAVGCIGDPFSDAGCYQKENRDRSHSRLLYMGIGLVIAIPLLMVIMALLCSADLVFANFMRGIDFDADTVIGQICMFVFAALSAYCGLRYLGKRRIKEEATVCRQFDPMIAITVLALVSVVYLFFSVIQIVYLFWGKMQIPEAYTYAEYAREGFFQLLFVCLLNVAMVLFVLAFFPKNALLKLLLTVISLCTYIMVASSAFRMTLYVQNYDLSFLRFLVFWGLAVIALLLVGILVYIFRPAFPLFRYGLVMFCICYLFLSYVHPDYWIAKYNLSEERVNSERALDYRYLSGLSSDAAGVLAEFAGEYENSSAWLDRYVKRLEEDTDDSIRRFNASHAYARSLFREELDALRAKQQEASAVENRR